MASDAVAIATRDFYRNIYFPVIPRHLYDDAREPPAVQAAGRIMTSRQQTNGAITGRREGEWEGEWEGGSGWDPVGPETHQKHTLPDCLCQTANFLARGALMRWVSCSARDLLDSSVLSVTGNPLHKDLSCPMCNCQPILKQVVTTTTPKEKNRAVCGRGRPSERAARAQTVPRAFARG